jgi:hypothetical protein
LTRKFFVSQEELKLSQKGTLQNPQDPSRRERAEVIQKLVEADDYINTSTVTKEQRQKTSQAFKQEQPDTKMTHLLDAGFDNQERFVYIDKELNDEFVIRLKLSRHSNEIYIDDKAKERDTKLKEVKLANKKRFPIQKAQIKNKVYLKASCLVEYGETTFEEQTYNVVRVTLKEKRPNK